ncbi:acyl-CoA dehydrogenase family protein [Streptomyces sp. NPDC091215]|uniref:acyl-CoA dehydrogenase family protein n=1 Tax=Streptomyces sp. NPDC091215 TaxID=3155192 RepID=UPI0034317BB5
MLERESHDLPEGGHRRPVKAAHQVGEGPPRSDRLQATLDCTDSRVQCGRPIGALQLTRKKPADVAVSWGRSALLAVQRGCPKDQGRIRPEQVGVGKLNNVRAALAITSGCRTVLGANGISLECSPLRHADNLESVPSAEYEEAFWRSQEQDPQSA